MGRVTVAGEGQVFTPMPFAWGWPISPMGEDGEGGAKADWETNGVGSETLIWATGLGVLKAGMGVAAPQGGRTTLSFWFWTQSRHTWSFWHLRPNLQRDWACMPQISDEGTSTGGGWDWRDMLRSVCARQSGGRENRLCVSPSTTVRLKWQGSPSSPCFTQQGVRITTSETLSTWIMRHCRTFGQWSSRLQNGTALMFPRAAWRRYSSSAAFLWTLLYGMATTPPSYRTMTSVMNEELSEATPRSFRIRSTYFGSTWKDLQFAICLQFPSKYKQHIRGRRSFSCCCSSDSAAWSFNPCVISRNSRGTLYMVFPFTCGSFTRTDGPTLTESMTAMGDGGRVRRAESPMKYRDC
eukprot:Sspe_Gene.55326::Locus_30431_Transcript_1_1_Confidence_1.000_Length_1322::g.55326::m.55326